MFASELQASESKKVSMAYVLPIPNLAREAEPLLHTIGNTPLLRLAKVAAGFPGI